MARTVLLFPTEVFITKEKPWAEGETPLILLVLKYYLLSLQWDHQLCGRQKRENNE